LERAQILGNQVLSQNPGVQLEFFPRKFGQESTKKARLQSKRAVEFKACRSAIQVKESLERQHVRCAMARIWFLQRIENQVAGGVTILVPGMATRLCSCWRASRLRTFSSSFFVA
jgi:hypothetical protein